MRSRTSFFSPAIFRKNLSRFYLLAILYLLAQLVVLPLMVQTTLNWDYQTAQPYEELMSVAVRTIYSSTNFCVIIAFFGAAASAMAVFSYLYTARSANMIGALPIRRESVFISSCAAIYAVVIVSNLISVLLTLALTMPMGLMLGKWLMQWFFIVLGQFTLFFGIAVLCANLTGSILTMPVIYLAVNFAAVGFAAVVSAIGSDLLYGVRMDIPDIFFRLSPLFLFMSTSSYGCVDGHYTSTMGRPDYNSYYYALTTELIVFAIVGLVLLLAAFLLHRRRVMESAGDVVAVRVLRPVFRVLFTLGVGLIGGYVFYSIFLNYYGDTVIQMSVSCAVFTAVSYILADMLLRKSTRPVFKKTAIPALCAALLVVGGIWSIHADLFGIESNVPEVSEVKEVSVHVQGEGFKSSDEKTIGYATALHHTVLDNKERNQNGDYYFTNIRLEYELFNGSSLVRYYEICTYESDDDTIPERELLDIIMNSPEGILARKELSVPVTEKTVVSGSVRIDNENGLSMELTPQEVCELYENCIYPDMVDGTIGLLDYGNYDRDYSFYNNEIEFYLYQPTETEANGEPGAGTEQYFYTYPTTESKRTNAWLAEHGVELKEDEMF
ncbi:MAG: hypothetical protein ACOX81_09285 [Candidatus Heteroscillospira sp.]|jgi:ABC-2 type transport system permease protein